MKIDWFIFSCPALAEEGSRELFIWCQALARHRTAEPRLCHFQAGGRDGRNQSRNRAAAEGSWKSADSQTTAGERHCCISLPPGWRAKQVLVLKRVRTYYLGRGCEVAGSRRTGVVLMFHKAGWWGLEKLPKEKNTPNPIKQRFLMYWRWVVSSTTTEGHGLRTCHGFHFSEDLRCDIKKLLQHPGATLVAAKQMCCCFLTWIHYVIPPPPSIQSKYYSCNPGKTPFLSF